VLLPQPIEEEALQLLKGSGCEVVLSPDAKPDTVAPLLPGSEAVILRTGIKITRQLLQRADALAIIARTGGGVDNVDVAAATEGGILVTANPGVNTSSVVEHVLALMLALSKRLFRMDAAVKGGDYAIRYRNLPRDLREKTVGLLGFGRIGSEIGRICRDAFQMQVLAHDPLLPEAARQRFGGRVEFVDQPTLFRQSDVISIHVPLTDQTRHSVGPQQLAWMKPDALLINTSRGPVVDEAALCEALRCRRIGGAGLDVLEHEPPAPGNPLLALENVILTPHTAALTRECTIRMATEAVQCVLDVFEGRRPPFIANPEALALERWKHLADKEP
jgi:D-3-phosphoglycerate dehydrogenase